MVLLKQPTRYKHICWSLYESLANIMLHCHTFWFKWNNVRSEIPSWGEEALDLWGSVTRTTSFVLKGQKLKNMVGKPEIYRHESVNKVLINSRAAALKESTHDWTVQSIVGALSSESRFNSPLKLIWSSERNDQCVDHDDAESGHTQRWCLFTWRREEPPQHLDLGPTAEP